METIDPRAARAARLPLADVLASITPGPPRRRPASIDLAEDLADDPRGQLTTWQVAGRRRLVEVLYYPPRGGYVGRGGVDDGTGVRWTDASSARDALVRVLTGRII